MHPVTVKTTALSGRNSLLRFTIKYERTRGSECLFAYQHDTRSRNPNALPDEASLTSVAAVLKELRKAFKDFAFRNRLGTRTGRHRRLRRENAQLDGQTVADLRARGWLKDVEIIKRR